MSNFKGRVLHIIHDEKFPDAAYIQFEEVAPGQNTWLLRHSGFKKQPIKYIKRIKNIIECNGYAYLNPFFMRWVNSFDLVVFHSFTGFATEVVARLKDSVKTLWIGMGFDYYDIMYPNKNNLYEAKTLDFLEKLNSVTNNLPKSTIFKFFKEAIKDNFFYKHKKIDQIKKINYFAPVLPEEFKMISSLVEPWNTKYIRWSYSTHLYEEKKLPFISGRNILIGNSATPTNNHVDLFYKLKKTGLPNDIKLIVPLSYGEKEYRDNLVELGKQLFGDQFTPILDFMAYDQYMELLSSCSTVLMNHKRQQGLGNISSALKMGAKVYINKSNPYYEHIQKDGVIIFDIDDLTDKRQLAPLTENEKQKNIENMKKRVKRREPFETTRLLLSTISNA